MHWLFLINEDIYAHCTQSFVYMVLILPSPRLVKPVLCGYMDRKHCAASPNFGFLVYKRAL